MKKKKLKKTVKLQAKYLADLEKELEHLRGCIPVFKTGLLDFEFELEADVEPGTSRQIIGPRGNPFTIKFTFDDRTEEYTGTVTDRKVTLDTE